MAVTRYQSRSLKNTHANDQADDDNGKVKITKLMYSRVRHASNIAYHPLTLMIPARRYKQAYADHLEITRLIMLMVNRIAHAGPLFAAIGVIMKGRLDEQP